MLGRKKKEDNQPQEQNDLDKPQTLAELDAMAREKKDDKVMLEDEGASAGDLDHEVTHSDEHTVDTNVKQVTSSQRKLQALVGLAVMILIFGGAIFYTQIEDGEGIGIGAGGSEVVVNPDEPSEGSDLLPRGTYAYVANPGGSSYQRFNLDDQSSGDIDLGASVTDSGLVPSFQLSSDSIVSAVKTSGGIVVKRLEETKTFFAGEIGQIEQWLLIPDGTRVYALVGNDLYSAEITAESAVLVAEGFAPSGAERTNLNYARDGSINMYAKSGGNMTGSIFSLKTGEVTTFDRTITRLENMGGFSPNSMSPDGTSIIFIAEISGNQTLQLLSLNSLVLRTVYLADAGNRPADFVWSSDSNNILVYESGVAPLISNLKVGVLEKEILQQNVSSAASLSWSPDKKVASYISGGTLRGITIESKEVSDLIDSVSAGAITGWFQN